MANWQAFSDLWNQGSFVSQVPAPNADPEAEPTVCVQFGAPWLPYVLGALFQLTQPSAWDPASAGFADVLTQAQALMAIFSEGGTCVGLLEFQCDPDTGQPQYSIDGGVTWIDLPDCFIGPEGPAGPTGATGPAGPPFVGQGTAPPNPQGVSTPQQACNIAAYLAADIVATSLQSFVDSKSAAKTQVDAVAGAVALLSGFDPIVDLIVAATALAANYVYSQTTSDYTDALGDPVFQSDVQCAIFEAIVADGYVTAANFPDVLANLAAISYAHADVVTTVHDFVQALDVTGLQLMQVSGTLFQGDCSSCASAPLNALSFNGGSSGHVQMASDIVFGSGAFTVGWWYSGSSVFQAGYDGVNANIVQLIAGDTNVITDIRDATATDHSVNPSGLASAARHQFMYTFAGAGGAIEVYRDGVSIGSGTGPSGSVNAAGGVTELGLATGFGYVTGDFKGLAVYVGTVLSAGDAAAWFAAGPNAAPPGTPTNYYPTNDGAGTTLTDVVGADNGTLSGGVSWTNFP